MPASARRTFDEVFGDVSEEERIALVWKLVAIRSRKLVEKLLPPRESAKKR
jgi:hypothetical protein